VSFSGFEPAEVVRSAQAVASQFQAFLDEFQSTLKQQAIRSRVEVLTLPGVHPYVMMSLEKDPALPTVLLYAHHDVQPPGRLERWKTQPFEPELREGPGGVRLYGRGTADDKAGILVHLSALRAHLENTGTLPLNVKVLIEGEEEIGSGNLGSFMRLHRERLQADALILTDTANFDCGVPGLTTSLRGLVSVEFELQALSKSIHSGLWGGPIPCVSLGLSKLLSTLVDERGEIAVESIRRLIPAPSRSRVQELRELPVDELRFRSQAGVLDTTRMLVSPKEYWERLWESPSLVVTAIQVASRLQSGNVLNDAAWAKVTLRLPPGVESLGILKALTQHLHDHAPWGMKVVVGESHEAPGWKTSAVGPAFEAAKRALHAGYGREAVFMGCGASIPFVQPIVEVLGQIPALLVGVEDPYTDAHGENESLLVSDFHSACKSQAVLLAELAACLRGKSQKEELK
jgi:acetylornithine deacetylase/succinyl-diaminopimelate desuccinylase-like protein